MKTAKIVLTLAMLSGAVAPYSWAATVSVETIALTGVDDSRGPGLGPSVVYNNITAVRFGPNDTLAIRSTIGGGSVANGIFAGTSDGLATLVTSGTAAPGVAGATFSSVTPAGFLEDGSFVYTATLSGSGISSANDSAAYQTGGSAPLFRDGNPAPGLVGPTIASFSNQVAGNRPTFRATLQGPGIISNNDQILYSGLTTTQVVREGFPEMNADLNANEYFGGMTARDSRGSVVHFSAEIFETAGNTSVGNGIFSWDGTNVTTIARTGDAAADAVDAQYADFSFRQITPQGDTVYRSNLTGAGVTAANNVGLYRTSGTDIELIARRGDPVPNTPGAVYSDVGFAAANGARLGESEVATFQATWNDGGLKGGWILHRGNEQHLVAAGGDVLPGLNPGETLEIPSTNDAALISNQGAMVFMNQILPTPGGQFQPGLWYYGLDNQIQHILRVGSAFDVDPTSGVDQRTVDTIGLSANAVMLSNRSFITQLRFTDGSQGYFKFTVVPEPAASTAATIGLLVALTRSNRRSRTFA